MSSTWRVLIVVMLMGLVAAAGAAHAHHDESGEVRDGCLEDMPGCGIGVDLGSGFGGIDNCPEDPNCRARRIVDVNHPELVSDFIPVPQMPGDGADAAAGGVGAEADGTPARCEPRPAGRVEPSFAQVDLPTGTIGANPDHAHLTGLESWFWYTGLTTVSWRSPVYVGVTADCAVVPPPAPVTYRAELVGFTWHLDGRHVVDRAGTEDEPAVRHGFEAKGPRMAEVDCRWRGAWGGEVVLPCAQRLIDVVEVRAELRDG